MVPVPLSPVSVPPSKKSPEAKLYRYHTNRYRYQHVIFAAFEQNSNSSARVRSSFDHQFMITMEKGIKAKGKVERCDTPIPGVPLTTRQTSEYPWMSSNPTPHHRVPFFGTHDLTKIGQSLLCMGSSTKNTTCIITWQHGPILYNDHTESTYE